MEGSIYLPFTDSVVSSAFLIDANVFVFTLFIARVTQALCVNI